MFKPTLAYAQSLDSQDPLKHLRDQFSLPKHTTGENTLYFTGNSLGLQPKKARENVIEMLDAWQTYGVKGHFEGDYPWMPYHEFLTEHSAELVGAQANEVVMMNSLTANLHLMMVSFYQPSSDKRKILIEDHAFPSDHYAVCSQLKHHGFDESDLLLWQPRADELLHLEDFEAILAKHHQEISLILLPGVQYYTGQVLPMQRLTELAHQYGITIGLDLAHAVGNVELALHDWQVDFACWCSYKYLNSGAGSVAGCFIHKKHCQNTELNRFAGWWGHDKATRFKMDNQFSPIPTAEGWQLSNPPVLSLAAIRGSLETFAMAGGIKPLREKSVKLTQYAVDLLQHELAGDIQIITPMEPEARGCQLSLMVTKAGLDGKALFNALDENGVVLDWREPNVMRFAPVPLYNSFEDVYQFVAILKRCLEK
ncbi:kynureninase [Thalassotalea sp. LPB0316]|uniref:kynureninase n=1 Tax=Thalassotalea sp. LPB0316 TaxID=2769490 RepID=UPI001865AB64|nr:kynureninase [Thalassotalea sp. LPB0316]QOL24489.1 kynureninase [Thalassotalea sp. LPB0316]